MYSTNIWSESEVRGRSLLLINPEELWIFFACVYTKKYVYNYSDLENCMSLAFRTSNAILIWLKIFALLYWRDWCILKHICGNILMLWNRSFMISTHDRKSMPIGNSQLSKTEYESCLKLLYYMVKSIEQKVFTFKHGLNIGQSTNRLLLIHLQV